MSRVPRSTWTLLFACGVTFLLSHCGGSTSESGARRDGSAGSAGQGGAAGAPQGCPSAKIDTDTPCSTDADCPLPFTYCGEVVPGGFRTCLRKPEVQTSCSSYPAKDECGCDGGTCPPGKQCLLADGPICGTGGSGPNLCSSGCTDADCAPGEACLRGLQPVLGACYAGPCRVDSDCGGCSRCEPYWTSLGGDCVPTLHGLRCTCLSDHDCKPGLKCVVEQGFPSGHPGFCL